MGKIGVGWGRGLIRYWGGEYFGFYLRVLDFYEYDMYLVGCSRGCDGIWESFHGY